MAISDEEKEDQKRMEECEEAERQQTVKEELKVLARRTRENSRIDWGAANRNRPSDAPKLLGCAICNGDIEQPEAFSDKENPGLCDNCRELVVRLAAK
jgi:hypothetical protein